MISWNFNPSNYDPEKSFEVIPVGDHRVRIEYASEETSKKGYDMIKLELAVSGYASKLFYYVVFMPERPDITDQNLGKLWDSFGLEPGNLNSQSWVGKVGACKVKHETYEGKAQARASYFILRSKQGDLPPWQEKGKAQPPKAQAFRDSYQPTGTDDDGEEANIPF